MNLTEEARRLLTCEELRGRVPQEVQDFLRKVAGLEPVAIVSTDDHGSPDWWRYTGAIFGLSHGNHWLAVIEKSRKTNFNLFPEEPRHDQP